MRTVRASVIKPLTDDGEILDFIHSLNGDYKHDRKILEERGIPRSVGDMIRRVFGKVSEPRKVLTQEYKDLIIESYQSGISVKEIAKRNNTTVGSVYSILKLGGIERNRSFSWSKIQRMRLVHMRENQHLTWEEIGKYFGKTLSACHMQYMYIKRQKQNGEAA